MPRLSTSSWLLPIVLTLGGVLGAAPASAAIITVDWALTPHHVQPLESGDSEYHDCTGASYSARSCTFMWQSGMELDGVRFSFYDDKWFDGYGIGNAVVGRIGPVCRPGLSPCFSTFTPVTLRMEGAANSGPSPNLFIRSSRGGLLRFPSVHGLTAIDFAGSDWRNITWLQFGFYVPDDCVDEPHEWRCQTSTEKALVVGDLIFRATVPEPGALALLVIAGLAVFGRRAVGCRRGPAPVIE